MFEFDCVYVSAESGAHRKFLLDLNKKINVARDRNVLLVRQFDGDSFNYSRSDSRVLYITGFNGDPHPDFKYVKKRKGYFPVKGTQAYEAFAAQENMPLTSSVISDRFGIPGSIRYEGNDGFGSSMLGYPLSECGVLFIPGKKPFVGFWMPDVDKSVRYYKEQGYTVTGKCATFKPEWDGCRVLLKEEFDLLMAEHKLKLKRKESRNAKA